MEQEQKDLLKNKIDFMEKEIEEYMLILFTKLMPFSKKQRLKIVVAIRTDLTQFITKILCVENQEELDKLIKEGK